MLWVRNGYIELTIILNHKNIQYMFTLPFLHTLPIIITNKETAFSDLVIFLADYNELLIYSPNYQERGEVCGWQCLVPFQTLQFPTRSEISWWAEYSTPTAPGWLTFLCCLHVHLHAQCDHSERLCLCSGQQHLQLLLGRGQGLWKGTWLGLWRGWARCWLQVVRKSSGSGQGTFRAAVSCLGCRGLMERAVEELSQPGLCPKRLGERGWVARHKKETNPPWLGHEGHKDSESPLKTST